MASKIGLISNALILIGDLPITSLTGNSRAQTVANNLYDNIVQNELTKFKWSFARKKASLNLTSEDPVGTEWDSIYQLPSDLLFLIKTNPSVPFNLYGDKLYSNLKSTLHIDYIYNAPESTWPVYFSKMIEYALAMDFAPSIRDSGSAMDANARQYVNASRMARYTDSQQHPVEPLASNPFVDVRG
jgi:hypothetical protein|tara:strand:+ start:2221 stop:2778 length:558 start_codon:yes stop_codon:yes gene_type:complete